MQDNGLEIWRGRIVRYAPLIFWIGVIFFLSSDQGSMAETSRFVGPILKFLFPNISEETLAVCHAFIRKSAHFIEYAILALLTCRAILKSSNKFLSANWIWLTIGVTTLVAVLDELNQSFNITRTGSPYDVLLDMSGGICVVVVVYFYKFRRLRSG